MDSKTICHAMLLSRTVLLVSAFWCFSAQGQTCDCEGGCDNSGATLPGSNGRIVNAAYGKAADMSITSLSDSGTTPACVAVNGRIETVVSNASSPVVNCVHTHENDTNPWWQVDLGLSYTVTDITVYSVKGENQGLAGTSVYVDDQLCYTFPNFSDTAALNNLTEQFNITCTPPLHGNVFKFQKNKYEENDFYSINICEVQVWVCKSGQYGKKCDQTCSGHCKDDDTCDNFYGTCPRGCEPGWTSPHCIETCQPGTYGDTCGKTCSGHCKDNDPCDNVRGTCPRGCGPGWTSPLCDQRCKPGMFGQNCGQTCSFHCKNNDTCDNVRGTCPRGCEPGRTLPHCNQSCPDGYFGNNCRFLCPPCTKRAYCDKVHGQCVIQCPSGTYSVGALCKENPPCNCTGGCEENGITLPGSDGSVLNLAYGKPTIMSSIFTENDKSNPACTAVNGRTGTVWRIEGDVNCVHTDRGDVGAWWHVDLTDVFTVTNITIYRRKDASRRMAGGSVFVDDQLCYSFPNSTNVTALDELPEQINITCIQPLTGQSVRFQKHGQDTDEQFYFINICEVQVWGCRPGMFGKSCDQTCSGHCNDSDNCDNYYGTCPRGCEPGWESPLCDKKTQSNNQEETYIYIGGAMFAGMCVIAISILVGLCIRRPRQRSHSDNTTEPSGTQGQETNTVIELRRPEEDNVGVTSDDGHAYNALNIDDVATDERDAHYTPFFSNSNNGNGNGQTFSSCSVYEITDRESSLSSVYENAHCERITGTVYNNNDRESSTSLVYENSNLENDTSTVYRNTIRESATSNVYQNTSSETEYGNVR